MNDGDYMERRVSDVTAGSREELRRMIQAGWEKAKIGALETVEGRVPSDAEVAEFGQELRCAKGCHRLLVWRNQPLVEMELRVGDGTPEGGELGVVQQVITGHCEPPYDPDFDTGKP